MGLLKLSEISFLLFFSTYSTAFALEAVYLEKLPFPTYSQIYYYDGTSDTIYLFGGLLDNNENGYRNNHDIYTFSISNHTVTKIGEIPSDLEVYFFSHIIPSTKSTPSNPLLYLLITYYYDMDVDFPLTHVFLFNGTDNTLTKETTVLPFSLFGSAMTISPNRDVYFIGGPGLAKRIIKVNLESENKLWEIVGNNQQLFSHYTTSATVSLNL